MLGRAAARLGVADHANDAGQRRVARGAASIRCCSAPSPLIVPAKTSSPVDFGHRQALAGDRRLVDVARAVEHAAVERNALAGLHQERGADGTSCGETCFVGAVAAEQPGGRRREVHQRGDRAAGAADAPGFQEQRERKQERDRGRLEPFADGHGADDGDRHQQVHVRLQPAERAPGLGQHEPNAGEDGDAEQHVGDVAASATDVLSDHRRAERQRRSPR